MSRTRTAALPKSNILFLSIASSLTAVSYQRLRQAKRCLLSRSPARRVPLRTSALRNRRLQTIREHLPALDGTLRSRSCRPGGKKYPRTGSPHPDCTNAQQSSRVTRQFLPPLRRTSLSHSLVTASEPTPRTVKSKRSSPRSGSLEGPPTAAAHRLSSHDQTHNHASAHTKNIADPPWTLEFIARCSVRIGSSFCATYL